MDPNAHSPASSRSSRQKPANDTSSVASSNPASSSRRPSADMTPQKPGAVASRPAGKVIDVERAIRTGSKDSLKPKPLKKLEDVPKPDKNEEMLKTLKTDLDSLRSLVTCKICDRLLYEPYVISCGHTYCYSCLCTWFVNNRSRKTCPDCRAPVVQPPAPAYLVREMASIFINRAELLPLGETLEQHKKWQQEEADSVQQDKNNDDMRTGGLFKGCFRVPHMRAIRDEEDGVDRCPLCAWELEDGECAQCGLQFDDSGDLAWENSFGGFSDMDETSEHDGLSEDLDADIDLEDQDDFGVDGYDDGMDDWQDQFEDDHPYAVRRWLANGAMAREYPPFGPRRPAAHSAAGSRRRSYSASLVSDMHTEDTEMGVLEEEDEDEDSSMNDFIDDDESGTPSQSTRSIQSHTPTPHSNSRTSRRRVVEPESPSTASSQQDDDDDNDDDEGPIPAGRRRQQYRNFSQARSNRRPRIAPSESTEGASMDQDFDEDTQALLYEGWSPLGHNGPDDEMDEDDDDDDSDGGRTTVGWEPTANSIERSRIGGSLTPTADRPNVAIRPPSRVGNSRMLDGSRGLRRRTSVLSTVSSTNYEDGEADDDDSDIDRDGDSSMRSPAVRPRTSRLRLRDPASTTNARPTPRTGLALNSTADHDTDDNSDDTTAPSGRRRPHVSRQEYDPRISWAFAQHMADIRDLNLQRPDLFDQLDQLRGATPVSRPRTSNRNRNSGVLAPAFSPLSNGSLPPFSPPTNAPPRLRTPLDQSPMSTTSSNMSPRSERTLSSISQSSNPGTEASNVGPRRLPTNVSGASVTVGSTSPASHTERGSVPQNWALPSDVIDRPLSRVGSRPPSAAGRRNSGAFNAAYQVPMSPGLNFAARFQAQQNRNPWNPFIALNPRPRQSMQRLREQSSTATLRPRNSQRALRQQPSQTSVRDAAAPIQPVRQQSSRVNLRSQPSQHRLSSQSSTRTLRGNTVPVAPQSPVAGPSVSPVGSARSRLTEEERLSRARELINSRQQALGTNPFTAGRSRQGSSQLSGTAIGAARTQHDNSSVQSLSGISTTSSQLITPQTAMSTTPNTSPGLGRRRSNRNIGAPPGAISPPQPQPSAPNNFVRARSGSAGVSPFSPHGRTTMHNNGITAGGNTAQY